MIDGGGHTDRELPGLRFSLEEILARVTIQQLFAQLAPGVLSLKPKPLQVRLADLMARYGSALGDVARRIRLVLAGRRLPQAQCLEAVAAATIRSLQLR